MTTDILENAIAFAKSESHEGDVRVILEQAKAACVTLAAELERLREELTYMTLQRDSLNRFIDAGAYGGISADDYELLHKLKAAEKGGEA